MGPMDADRNVINICIPSALDKCARFDRFTQSPECAQPHEDSS